LGLMVPVLVISQLKIQYKLFVWCKKNVPALFQLFNRSFLSLFDMISGLKRVG